jgi:LemA protein
MKNKKILVWGGILAFVLILVFWFMGIYNNAVAYEEEVDEAWGNVQSQYQRRFDLYPPIIDAIEGAAKQESKVLIAISEARALVKQASQASNPAELQQSSAQLAAVGTSLLGYQERYPELKSLDLFKNFQVQIEGTENRINKARDTYNAAVKKFNTHIRKFPNSMLTGSFDKREAFKADTEAKDRPKTDINTE